MRTDAAVATDDGGVDTRQALRVEPDRSHLIYSSFIETRLFSSGLIMPPRPSNERLDFTPILTHYLFLFTTVFAVVSSLLCCLWYDISLMLTFFFSFLKLPVCVDHCLYCTNSCDSKP
jgi:hypothetical protein